MAPGDGLRKKFCSVAVCSAGKVSDYAEVFEKTEAYKATATLKAAEAHRLFVFSAELWSESATQPWCNPPSCSAGAEFAIQFTLAQRGPADVLLFCDGRSRTCRAAIEQLCGEARFPTEIFVIYAPTRRLGRRVAWSGATCEMMLASFPVNRTLLASKDRGKDFAAAGESSTHDNTYSGVQPVPWAGLPLVSLTDKARAFGVEVDTLEVPKQSMHDASGGVPLFWQERKPVPLWRRIFEDLSARSVVDLTPGGGLAARAAMEMGISYIGLARSAEQGQWLTAACDRAALIAAVTPGTAMYNQDLQAGVEEHFGDIIEHLREADAAVDREGPDDDAD